MKIYSQNDEQQVIGEFFNGRVGRFLDIGAYDGMTFSNTRALLEHGWNGVLVEPSPMNVCKLMDGLGGMYDRSVVINAAVGPRNGMGRLYLDRTPERGWAATLSDRMHASVLNPHPAHLKIPILGINELACLGPYEFLSLDAEGMDIAILDAMNPAFLRQFELLCVEPHDTEERQLMKDWFARREFSVHHETPENLIVRRL